MTTKSTYKSFGEGLTRYKAFLKKRIDKKYHRLIDSLSSIRFYGLATTHNGLEEHYEPIYYEQEVLNSEKHTGRFKDYVLLKELTNEFLLTEKESTIQCFAIINQQKNTYKDLNVGSLIAQYL